MRADNLGTLNVYGMNKKSINGSYLGFFEIYTRRNFFTELFKFWRW